MSGLLFFFVLVWNLACFWLIAKKAGYPGWWSLIMLIPFVNIIVAWIFPFAEWPAFAKRKSWVSQASEYSAHAEHSSGTSHQVATSPGVKAAVIDEDAIYASIADELETGATDKGLWTRLFAQCEGDENKTKAAYIMHRAIKLIAEKRAELAAAAPVPEAIHPVVDTPAKASVVEQNHVAAIKVAPQPAANSHYDSWAHELAATEFENSKVDQALWDLAFAEAGNDKAIAKALYINRRAQVLIDDERNGMHRPPPVVNKVLNAASDEQAKHSVMQETPLERETSQSSTKPDTASESARPFRSTPTPEKAFNPAGPLIIFFGIVVSVAIAFNLIYPDTPVPAQHQPESTVNQSPVALPPGGAISVKIGHVGPLTGGISHLGRDNENGARLAIEEANNDNIMIGGRVVKFELLAYDDQANPNIGNDVAQRLVHAKVAGVVGHLNSGTSIPASAIYNNAGIPMISGSATNPALTEQGYKGVFRVVGRDDHQGQAIAHFISGAVKAKSVAVIDDSTPYGEIIANEVENTLKTKGVTVLPREKGTDTTVDWKTVLSRIKSMKPDAIFYGGMDVTGGPLLKQAREMKIGALFAFGDGACTDRMAELAGEAAENLVCSQAGIPVQAASKQFLDSYRAKYNINPILYSPFTYDAVKLLITAMQKAGSTEPNKYLPVLQTIDYNGASGTIRFDEKGDRRNAEVTIFIMKEHLISPLAIVNGSYLLTIDEFKSHQYARGELQHSNYDHFAQVLEKDFTEKLKRSRRIREYFSTQSYSLVTDEASKGAYLPVDYNIVGISYYSTRNYEDAIRLFLLAEKHDKASPVIKTNLGDAYVGAEKYTLAKRKYNEALKIDPNNIRAKEGLSFTDNLNIGSAQRQNKDKRSERTEDTAKILEGMSNGFGWGNYSNR